MRVKICGLTREDDAKRAEELGAWALGFIFYQKSPRYIVPEAAQKIIANRTAPAVGVFVNQMFAAPSIALQAGLKAIQLHGDETPEDCDRLRDNFGGIIIKAFRLMSERDVDSVGAYLNHADYALLDSGAGGQYGGTGQTFDWSLAKKAAGAGIPIILAGGLNAENVAAAVAEVNPHAVDLSSGVESAPGVKDAAKLDALFGALGRTAA